MAKIKLDPRSNISERAFTYTGKRPSFAGSISIRPSPSGEPVAAVFPPKRSVVTQKEKLTHLWMRYMAYIYKVTHPFFLENYKNQALGLWLQPRDIFYAAMSGRLFAFSDEGGKYYYSVAARKDMSESLDVLSQIPGSLLVRNQSCWDGLAPGSPGEVLTVSFGGMPTWQKINTLLSSESRTSGLISQFYHVGQGAGLVSLSSNIKAIRMSGTSTSDVVWSVYCPVNAHKASVALYFNRYGSDGGDYSHGLQAYVVKSDASVVLHSEENREDPAPAPGGVAVYTFQLGDFLYDLERVGLVLRYVRYGAIPEDSNNSYSYFWFYEVSRW